MRISINKALAYFREAAIQIHSFGPTKLKHILAESADNADGHGLFFFWIRQIFKPKIGIFRSQR